MWEYHPPSESPPPRGDSDGADNNAEDGDTDKGCDNSDIITDSSHLSQKLQSCQEKYSVLGQLTQI